MMQRNSLWPGLLWMALLAGCNLPVQMAAPDLPTPTTFPPTLTVAPAPTSTPQPGTVWLRPSDQMPMIYIPGGSFQMGSAADGSSQPVHTVTLDPFWLDQTEVTNARYKLCVIAKACTAPANPEGYDQDNLPVVYVNWTQAKAYCNWAGGDTQSMHLPSEAQWEFAARGTDERTYPWGNEWDCSKTNAGGTCGSDTFEGLAPIGSFPAGASPLGVLDLTGNAWEWVYDLHTPRYYQAYPPDQWPPNPTGPETGLEFHVVRGGAWKSNNSIYLRAYSRVRGGTEEALATTGFRCARSLQ